IDKGLLRSVSADDGLGACGSLLLEFASDFPPKPRQGAGADPNTAVWFARVFGGSRCARVAPTDNLILERLLNQSSQSLVPALNCGMVGSDRNSPFSQDRLVP